MRAVVDTSVLIRALINPTGTVGTVGPVVLGLRRDEYRLLYSTAFLDELVTAMGKPRLRARRGVTPNDIEDVVGLIRERGICIEPDLSVRACRDPNDDIFLQVAVAGRADAIVTGDKDLLVLDPFRGIPVVGPAVFLAMLESRRLAGRLLNEPTPVWVARSASRRPRAGQSVSSPAL